MTIEDRTASAPSTKLDMIETVIGNAYNLVLGDTKIIVESGTTYTGVQSRGNNTFSMHIDWLSAQTDTTLDTVLTDAFFGNIWVKANIHSDIRLASGKGATKGRFASNNWTKYQKASNRIASQTAKNSSVYGS
ncbi:MAG: hypothetical protein LBC60_05155 [Spirochaetaceae bacterium]|nr:hypothetical protein [Spirochaetaceae bacterium]